MSHPRRAVFRARDHIDALDISFPLQSSRERVTKRPLHRTPDCDTVPLHNINKKLLLLLGIPALFFGILVLMAIGHLLLTGATENRGTLVDQFQSDPSKTVFLLSLKAAGFGLNLTAASYAILYDPWWNPAAESQAIDRIHRIGQTRPVIAYRLISDGTIEQKIRALQRDKAALAASVIQEDNLAQVMDLESLRNVLA